MTDYLEALEEDEDFLRELERTLERALPNWGPEWGEAPGRGVARGEYGQTERDGRTPRRAREHSRTAGATPEEPAETARADEAAGYGETQNAGREESALLAQLTRLERMDPGPSPFLENRESQSREPGRGGGERAPWRGTGVAGRPPWGTWTAGGGAGETARPSGGDEGSRWAEWADRAFRRDSRRYDGGFYLY